MDFLSPLKAGSPETPRIEDEDDGDDEEADEVELGRPCSGFPPTIVDLVDPLEEPIVTGGPRTTDSFVPTSPIVERDNSKGDPGVSDLFSTRTCCCCCHSPSSAHCCGLAARSPPTPTVTGESVLPGGEGGEWIPSR